MARRRKAKKLFPTSEFHQFRNKNGIPGYNGRAVKRIAHATIIAQINDTSKNSVASADMPKFSQRNLVNPIIYSFGYEQIPVNYCPN